MTWTAIHTAARQCVEDMRRTKHGPRAVAIVERWLTLIAKETREAVALETRSAGAGTPGPAGTGELAEPCKACSGCGTELTRTSFTLCRECHGSGRSPTTRPERQNNE